MTNTFWHPDNKQWMAQRKQEWQHVKLSLDIMRNIKKMHYKYHKELFFTGEVDQSDNLTFSVGSGDTPFDFILFFYEMWYHPEPSEAVFKEFFEAQTNPSTLARARDLLFRFQLEQFPLDYGMLGGREELFVKTLLPSNNWQEERWFEVVKKGYPLCLTPNNIAHECLRGTQPFLVGSIDNIYAPGQYLWNYFSDNFHLVTKHLEGIKDRMLYIIKNYEHLEKFPLDNPLSVNMAKSLKSRFDNGEFSPALLDFYMQVDSLE